MNIDVRTLDITEALAALQGRTEPPHALIKRTINPDLQPRSATFPVDTAVWHVLNSSMPKQTHEMVWSVDKAGTHVAVPMFPYLLPDRSLSGLVKLGGQLSTLIAMQVLARCRPERLIILISNIYGRVDGVDGFTAYIGAAVREEKR